METPFGRHVVASELSKACVWYSIGIDDDLPMSINDNNGIKSASEFNDIAWISTVDTNCLKCEPEGNHTESCTHGCRLMSRN